MGDWSNNLEYEQREYYGHLYDTDEDVHEEEETDDLISKQKVLNTLDFIDKACIGEERIVEKYKELLTECIKVLPSSENDGDLISRQAVLETIDSRIEQIKKNTNAMNKSYPHLSFAEGVHDGYCRLKCDLRILPSVSVSENPNKCFDGMTNGEVIKALFPNIKLIEKVYTTRKYALMDKSVKALLFLKTTDRWWNAPYKAERGET